MNRVVFCVLMGMGGIAVEGQTAFGQTRVSSVPQSAMLFKKLDRNSDGALTADELGKAQRKYFARLLRIGDRNGDGKLTLKEFTTAVDRKYDPVQPGGGFPQGRPQPLSFDRLDKNKDGKITLQEVPEQLRRRFQPVFRRLKKKELTRAEFTRAARQFTVAGRRRFAEAMFKRLDANRDGKVAADEAKDDRAKRYLAFLLRRAGKQADGSLSKREFLKAAAQPPQGTQRRPNAGALLRRFDKNRDGVISKAEAAGGLKTNFDRIDRNADGKLDREELSAALRRRSRE
ncbi:MAG: EF-hand domain-containing protein [Planctomycetaceae bacterium]